jgi:hypothetical protein
MHPTPVLEGEWDIGSMILILDIHDPTFIHGPCLRAGFAPGYDSIDALQVEVGKRANEWLQGAELDEGTRLTQGIDAVDHPLILHGNAYLAIFQRLLSLSF